MGPGGSRIRRRSQLPRRTHGSHQARDAAPGPGRRRRPRRVQRLHRQSPRRLTPVLLDRYRSPSAGRAPRKPHPHQLGLLPTWPLQPDVAGSRGDPRREDHRVRPHRRLVAGRHRRAGGPRQGLHAARPRDHHPGRAVPHRQGSGHRIRRSAGIQPHREHGRVPAPCQRSRHPEGRLAGQLEVR